MQSMAAVAASTRGRFLCLRSGAAVYLLECIKTSEKSSVNGTQVSAIISPAGPSYQMRCI